MLYAPPSNSVIERFVGDVVHSVTFVLHDIFINTERGNRITVSAPFRHTTDATQHDSAWEAFPVTASRLMAVVGKAIASAGAEQDGTLHIAFDDGSSLSVSAESEWYESYCLLIDGTEYVV